MNKNIVIIICSIISFVIGIFGIMAIDLYTKASNKNYELQQTIENQNKLIKILEVSCECECEE